MFRFAATFCVVFLGLAPLSSDSRPLLPDRVPAPDGTVALSVEPLALALPDGPIRLSGAWQLSAPDKRFAGLSALAIGPNGLVAVSDSGTVAEFVRPGGARAVRLRDLGGGPGFATYKKYRDSEAVILSRDGSRYSLTAAFEFVHSLWFFDDSLAVRKSVPIPSRDWRDNRGIEAMVRGPGGSGLLLIPESGNLVIRFSNGRFRGVPLVGATGGIADAVQLADGRVVVAVRELTPLGIVNRLAWLGRTDAGYRLRPFSRLRLGPFDNIEGLAAEPLPGGTTRLWAVSDNDGWRRTLLLAIELPAGRDPKP